MITCDHREPKKPQNIVTLIDDLGVKAEWETLEVGDYMMFDRDDNMNIVTRKAGDLCQSTFSGHFSDELDHCLELVTDYSDNGKVFFLLEGPWAQYGNGLAHFKRAGDWFRVGQSHSCDRSLLPNVELSLQTAGLFVVHTTSLRETAQALVAIYRRGQEGWPTKLARSIKRPQLRWSNDNRVSKLMALCPKLPERVATELLSLHGDIGQIIDMARDDDYSDYLLTTKGFGKTLLKNLQESLK